MRKLTRTRWMVCALTLITGNAALPDGPPSAERLSQTRAVNIAEVIDAQFVSAQAADGFRLADPYGDDAAETVQRWTRDPGRRRAVCALRFLDAAQRDYTLRDFESAQAATAAGFSVTHYGRCGSCSTLRDLAVYLARRDLVTPARRCARRFGLQRQQQCFQQEIGFTAFCAESWAYNARHTRQACLSTCIADYGLFNLILDRPPGPNTDPAGQLRPCLRCDEQRSGPGFEYSAGRTRRNSGIESAIPRPEAEIRAVDHHRYFQ